MRAYMAIYGGIHRSHGSSNGACMGAYISHMGAVMGHTCAHTWAIYGGIHGPHGSSNGACMGAYMAIYGSSNGACMRAYMDMAHSCPYKLYIASAKRLIQIRYKAWRFLTAFLIVLIFVPLNGACMRAYIGHMGAAIGHVYAHTWPYMGAYMGHMGAAMGHACAHTWAIYGGSNGACIRAYMAIYGATWEQQ